MGKVGKPSENHRKTIGNDGFMGFSMGFLAACTRLHHYYWLVVWSVFILSYVGNSIPN